MAKCESVLSILDELICFLTKYDMMWWVDYLTGIRMQMVDDKISSDDDLISRLFGGMGSLTDLGIYIPNDIDAARQANTELSRLTATLYELATNPPPRGAEGGGGSEEGNP